jgi:CRISPR-associated protein Cas5d
VINGAAAHNLEVLGEQLTRDLGFMLWDFDHAGDRSSLFFRARLDKGVMKIPPPGSAEIRR